MIGWIDLGYLAEMEEEVIQEVYVIQITILTLSVVPSLFIVWS